MSKNYQYPSFPHGSLENRDFFEIEIKILIKFLSFAHTNQSENFLETTKLTQKNS